MCGIAGIIQSNNLLYTRDHLKKMTDSLAHRGPDGEGLWQNSTADALLGNRRLAIIDLSEAGNQPIHYRNRYSVIHNGEIYNYLELKEELKNKGFQFYSQTDTEVIVAAYDCWGSSCLAHFDGMFAFAIWDEEKKQLFAARDRFGEKPFYYHFDGQHFLFASEMKALWAAGIERSVNRKMLFNFITIGYTDNPAKRDETFFENICKLPAASYLTFDLADQQLSETKYWDLDLQSENKTISDEQATERFIQLFSTSVKRRLRSDVAVGTSLSGGLDSSAVVAMIDATRSSAKGKINFPSKTFTALFPGFEKNEGAFAEQVSNQFNLQKFTVDLSAAELLNDWEKLCHHQEEPFGSASSWAQYKVYELAKQQGVTVLLDGQGADEMLAGYHKYYKWYWQELFRNRKLFRSKEIKAARKLDIREKFGLTNMVAAYFPSVATVVLENQYLLKAIRQEDLTKDFAKLQSKEAYYTIPDRFTLNGALYFNTCIHGLEELLRYADRNSMAHGREVRLPFLSHELAEFIFSLPSHFKIRQGWTKWLLRESMKDKLPAGITWRKDKVGFEPPQKTWMENKTIKEAIHAAKVKLVNEKILKPEALNKKIEPKSAHAGDNYDWRYFSSGLLF